MTEASRANPNVSDSRMTSLGHVSLSDAQVAIEALAAENLRLQQALALRDGALNASTSGFMIIDMQARKRPIVYANRALAVRSGFSMDELLGQPSSILTPKEPNVDRAPLIREAMLEGKELRIELQSGRKDGSTYWSGVALAPIFDAAGTLTHYVSVSADITVRLEADRRRQELQDKLEAEMQERKRVETELYLAQKLESVGRLAAGVAHEINTPIQYVGDSAHFLQAAYNDLHNMVQKYRNGLQQIIAGEPAATVKTQCDVDEQTYDIAFLEEETPKAFDRMLEGVERVAAIVRAMKEFSHPDATEHSEADINHAIETTLVVAKNEYKYVATVKTDLHELPPVLCNIGELNQVFLNLIVNSAHAITEAGHGIDTGQITIESRLVDDAVELTFNDNGCGIPQANIDKVFDPFFTTKEIGKGTGQGLAITRSIIVDKHRGQVRVSSNVGVGTTFVLRLPISGSAGQQDQGATQS